MSLTLNAVDRIRVDIRSDDRLFMQSIKLALEREGDISVVTEVDEPRKTSGAEETSADVVLFATGALDKRGESFHSLLEHNPERRVLLIGLEGDEKVQLEALQSGVSGFLTKDQSVLELIEAIRSAYRGDTYIPQSILRSLLAGLVHKQKERSEALLRAGRLTRREKEVLVLLTKGADTSDIARALVISTETARTHVQHILCKLGVHSRLEAATLIIESEILDTLGQTESK